MLSRNDYKILHTLCQMSATNEMKSLTILRLNELTQLSVSKIRKTITIFKELMYISDGVVEHTAKTYYITEKGITKMNKLIKE